MCTVEFVDPRHFIWEFRYQETAVKTTWFCLKCFNIPDFYLGIEFTCNIEIPVSETLCHKQYSFQIISLSLSYGQMCLYYHLPYLIKNKCNFQFICPTIWSPKGEIVHHIGFLFTIFRFSTRFLLWKDSDMGVIKTASNKL